MKLCYSPLHVPDPNKTLNKTPLRAGVCKYRPSKQKIKQGRVGRGDLAPFCLLYICEEKILNTTSRRQTCFLLANPPSMNVSRDTVKCPIVTRRPLLSNCSIIFVVRLIFLPFIYSQRFAIDPGPISSR